MPVKIFQLQVHVRWQSRSSNFFLSRAYYICTWAIVSLCSRMAERRGRQNSCVRQTWQGYYFWILSWPSLNIMFSGLITNIMVKFGGKFVQTKLLSRLSHKVYHLLSSPIVCVSSPISKWLALSLTNLYSWRDFSIASNLVSHNFALAIASLRTDSFFAFFPSFLPFFLLWPRETI